MLGNNRLKNYSHVHKFNHELKMYRESNLSEENFTAIRLANGVYGQRQDNRFMVRIKVPGGKLTVDQLTCVNDLVNSYTDVDFCNITTRQDIQLHFVSMENVPKVLLRLSDVGLTTREACGNTVRNVTACHLAGTCNKEHVNVLPIVNDAVNQFMGHALTQYMPRKVKMSFSGCEQDCAMSMIHDIGFVATKDEGKLGFKVMAGGGLGHKPRHAVTLNNFVPVDDVNIVIESIVSLHNQHSDRKRRAKSRIKFLIEKFGETGFRERYRQKFDQIHEKYRSRKPEEHALTFCRSESTKGKFLDLKKTKEIEISLPLGDLTNAMFNRLAPILKKFEIDQIRTTQSQNLVLHEVPISKLDKLMKSLTREDIVVGELNLFGENNVVTCPGNWTCRLGITDSRGLGLRIAKATGLKIHISGCHNGCAQPQLADIGLHGEGKRIFGKLVPYYRMYFGGSGVQYGGFGMRGPEIPAARAEEAIHKVNRAYSCDKETDESFRNWAQRKGQEFFTEMLEDLLLVTADELSSLLRDVGSDKEFKVLQLGGGECAGISEETLSSHLAELRYEREYRDIFLRQSKISAAIECLQSMLVLIGKSILFSQGVSVSRNIEEIVGKMDGDLKNYGALSSVYSGFSKSMNEIRGSENVSRFSELADEVDALIQDIVDERNNIVLDKYYRDFSSEASTTIDVTQEVCPMHYIKARQALRGVKAGGSITVLVNSGKDEKLVRDSLSSVGFDVTLADESRSDDLCVLNVRKPVGWDDGTPNKLDSAVA